MDRDVEFKGKLSKGTEVGFDTIREEWNEYSLRDGTTLKVKIAVTGILRVNGEFNVDGDPVYMIKSTNLVVSSNVQEHLRKK